MFRSKNKYFYILLIVVAAGLEFVLPAWYLFALCDLTFFSALVTYLATVCAATVASLLFMFASAKLEYRKDTEEH